MKNITLDTPIQEALGSKSVFLKRLEKLGIKTIRNLLWHFPVRYEDFSQIYHINELEPGQEATVCGEIEESNTKRTWQRGMAVTEAIITDSTGSIRAVWFNQPYIANALKVGSMANLAGKVSISHENELYFNNPSYEILHDGTETKHTGRLVPIYPETKGLTSRGLRFIIENIFKNRPPIIEWIPETILAHYRLPKIQQAIHNIHFPNEINDSVVAKKRFAFEELFLLQIWNVTQKFHLAQQKAPAFVANIEEIKTILTKLPFALTQSQKRSLWEIIQDMERPRPMHRLLQGDVGSGKTVIAALSAIIAAKNGYQTAFMAPTEILVRQHFETMKNLCAKISAQAQPVIGLITGTNSIIFFENDVEAKISKKEFSEKAARGEIAIIFGTHALIQKSMKFKNLGLVIVDEQHRFGVSQRQFLTRKTKTEQPHFLSMSATPIPRTLMLTVFGDLDISLITELPSGRKPIETRIVKPNERNDAYQFVRNQIKEGRQAFVICPRIDPPDESETNTIPNRYRTMALLEVKSVKEEYEKLSKKIFPDLRVDLLHGQMKSKEKEEIMKKFKDDAIDILVATSVIEVGLDVPNASIMLIEGTDRFGLAQLYQFRGRVGRGAHQSYCFMFSDSESSAARARQKAIVNAKNGFELAEMDLKLRGPGEFLGVAQSGFPDAAMEALRNPELVKQSREAAIELLKNDPHLLHAPLLKQKLAEFEKSVHRE